MSYSSSNINWVSLPFFILFFSSVWLFPWVFSFLKLSYLFELLVLFELFEDSILINVKLLEDVCISIGIEFRNMGVLRPIAIVNSSPTNLHFVSAVPSLELSVFEDQPSCTEMVSLFEASVFDVVFVVVEELDVINLRAVWIGNSCSNEVNDVFAFPALDFEHFFVDFEITREEVFNNSSVELNGKSVAILVPKPIPGSMFKDQEEPNKLAFVSLFSPAFIDFLILE